MASPGHVLPGQDCATGPDGMTGPDVAAALAILAGAAGMALPVNAAACFIAASSPLVAC